jgi:hypothetical protein
MPSHWINASHHCQVCSMGCSGRQNECQLQYHTADSVLTSGCFFISQHVWIIICINICIVLTIWAVATGVQDSAQGRDVRKYTHPAGKLMMWEH